MTNDELKANLAKINLTRGDTQAIIDAGRKEGLLRNEMAYTLATAFHETAFTVRPITEYGGVEYLRGKKYYPYYGRGYIQVTWKYNYEMVAEKLGLPKDAFLKNPEQLLERKIAIPALVRGMKEGWYTGKKLSDYITISRSGYINARRIVNGTDKAGDIAAYAKRYEELLKSAGYGENRDPIKTVTIEEVIAKQEEPEMNTSAGGSALVKIIRILLKLFGMARK